MTNQKIWFFNKRKSDRIYLWLIGLMLVGLVCSKFLMSITMILCSLNLLLEANFKLYWQKIKENHFLHLIVAFYLLHLISLLWSENLSYGLNDLRVKAPLLVIPVLLIAKPIEKSERKWLYLLFTLSLLVTSVINFCTYQFALANHSVKDIRELSLFGSHIRYAVLIAFGFGICLFLSRELKKPRLLWFLIGAWFIFYTYYSQVLSGLLALIIVITIQAVLQYKQMKWLIISGLAAGGISLIALTLFLFNPSKETTSNWGNIPEMREKWNKISLLDFDSLDLKKQSLKTTLSRYLDSKKLPRNAFGLSSLNKSDVQNIENGYADVNETRFGLIARMYGLRYQIQHPQNPNGHSLLQRIESWQTAWQIIQKNWLFGVGAGDVADEFEKKYNENRSLLIKENRIRAHNSYLTYWLSFGIFGILLFLYLQAAFFSKQIRDKNYLGILFVSISIISFLLEDTLETQTGVTFFAFFFAIYVSKETRLNDN